MIFLKKRTLPRRLFLQASGTSLIMPTLDIMLNDNGTAYADDTEFSKKYVYMFMGNSHTNQGGDISGRSPSCLAPMEFGPITDLSEGRHSLTHYPELLQYTSIISGLNIGSGDENGNISGPESRHHAYSLFPEIMGFTRVGSDNIPMDDSCIVKASRFLTGSLLPYIGARAENSVSGKKCEIAIDMGRDQTVADVQAMYSQLFGNLPNTSSAESPDTGREAGIQNLINRHILNERDSLFKKIGKEDRVVIEEYFDSLNQIQKSAEGLQNITCEAPQLPGVEGSTLKARAQVMTDMIRLALSCDIINSAGLMLLKCQSFAPLDFTNQDAKYHNLSGNTLEQVRRISGQYHPLQHGHKEPGAALKPYMREYVSSVISWGADHLYQIAEGLRNTRQGAGSMLDRSVLSLGFESGYTLSGSRIGEIHTGLNKAMLLISGLPSITCGGQHIDGNGFHTAAVRLKCLQLLGYKGANLGQISTPFEDITG